MKQRKTGALVPYQRVLPKIKKPKDPKIDDSMRKVTTSQIAVLLYHFFIGVSDPNVYYFDSEESPEKLQERINSEIDIPKDALEKLLFYTTLAYENKTYWNPENMEYQQFIRSFLEKSEKYDQLSSLIVKNKNIKGRLI